jgi:hypothetical protein
VLSKGDGDQPVVDLQVGQDVEHQDLLESSLAGPEADGREDDQETDVGHDDLGPVFGLEDDRGRLEVCEERLFNTCSRATRRGIHSRLVILGYLLCPEAFLIK